MVKLGADGLSRNIFPTEGLTLSPMGVRKLHTFAEDTWKALVNKHGKHNVKLTAINLDGFGSPRQNPCQVNYLSRIHDADDNKCLQTSFFDYDFERLERAHAPDFIYLFPVSRNCLSLWNLCDLCLYF